MVVVGDRYEDRERVVCRVCFGFFVVRLFWGYYKIGVYLEGRG